MIRRGFTLIELLVVMAIMGLLATASVTSYRTMRQGMEEYSVVKNASQFIRLAYQRSRIDRVPVNVYFWNETRSVEDEDKGTKLSVAGRATAVRRLGRITSVEGNYLLDEFGDLEIYAEKDENGQITGNTPKGEMYLYQVNGEETSFVRSIVASSTMRWSVEDVRMISDPEWTTGSGWSIDVYGFYLPPGDHGADWKKGDAYGLEFGDFELPNGYIFGPSYSTSIDSPVKEVRVLNFNPLIENLGSGNTIQIYALRPNAQGELAAKSLDSTTAPDDTIEQQNE